MAKTKNTNIKEEVEKDIAIKKEITKINSVLKNLDKKTKKAISSLVENAAFMAVTLRELKDTMNREGLICEYQNGENQSGIKKSPQVDIYNTMVKNYISAMKQITDLLPKGSLKVDDGFEEFVNGKG